MYALYYDHPSLESFQKFAGLAVTGRLDEDTVEKLYAPRCGVSDALRASAQSRWNKRLLNYYIDSYPPQLAISVVEAVYREAFTYWELAADLKFSQIRRAAGADLVLSTGRGPRSGFDGPSGTLAWAYLPTGNDQPLLCRFDLDERWVHDLNRDILLLAVACHEFGHLIGLDHDSQGSQSLMAPFYNRLTYKPQANDIRRIQGIYGPPNQPPKEQIDPLWVQKLYRDVLGREAAAHEVTAWQLRATRLEVAKGIVGSNEAHKTTVENWYRKYLRREPDGEGLSAHLGKLNSGTHPDLALAEFLTSEEYSR